MNAADRKALTKLWEEISVLQGKLQDAKGEAEALQSAEQDKFDNMSEGLQQGATGQAIEESTERLDEVVQSFDDVDSALETLLTALDDAKGGL